MFLTKIFHQQHDEPGRFGPFTQQFPFPLPQPPDEPP